MTPTDPTQDPQYLRRVPTLLNPETPVAAGAPPPSPQPERVPLAKSAPDQRTTQIPMPQIGQAGESPRARDLRDLQEQGSRISRIHNPVGRAFASIGDAIFGTFAPRAEALIPGTEGNYAMKLGRAERAADLGQKRELEQAQEARAREEAESQLPLRQAQTEQAQARAESLRNPKRTKEAGTVHEDREGNMWVVHPDGTATAVAPQGGSQLQGKTPKEKTGTVHEDDQGNMWLVKGDGTATPITPKGSETQLKGKPAAGKEGEIALGSFADQMNAANEQRYQVLHPGQKLPENYRLTAQSTQKQADEIRNLLAGTESAEGVKTAREQARATAEAGREHRSTQELRTAGMKAYTPALDSAERFNVMAKNYEDAVRNHDQQAMLSLLANHLGMTMGLQKGSRLTRDIINEAKQSRPWLQGMESKFDKNGYLSGVTLTPPQMRQMVDLGRERFSEDINKGRAESRYMGVNDEGPERTPSKATINHYTALANGDAAKAKQLAAADGWTVK